MVMFCKAKCSESVLHHGPRRLDAHLHDVRIQVGENASLNIIANVQLYNVHLTLTTTLH
jgi:hypothetical protein